MGFTTLVTGPFLQWPESWDKPDSMLDITFLELVPIVLSIYLFKNELRNKQILFHTDNKALVAILNKKSSNFYHFFK